VHPWDRETGDVKVKATGGGLRRLWLLFAQVVTVALAVYLVLLAVRPDWLNRLAPQQRAPATVANSVPVLEGTGRPAPDSYREAATRAMPAVVNILSSKGLGEDHPLMRDPFFRRFFGNQVPQERRTSLGSGVIVSPDGYILTNNHVIEAADEIQVILSDGRKAPARVVGIDPDTDLAVIQIGLKQLPAIVLGHSDSAKVGDVVLAIGNPFGVGQTVTMGIISATGRTNLHINRLENFIQTDAAINVGNSGGALVDTRGNLIGINTAIYSQSGGSVGIGFAIPVSTAKEVMDAIIKHGQVVRGWIGVETQDVTPELADNFGLSVTEGVIITGMMRGSPADEAGLRPGDILVAMDGKKIASTSQLLSTVAQQAPGRRVSVVAVRKNREVPLQLTVGRRPRLE
jgi:serine protease DegQ